MRLPKATTNTHGQQVDGMMTLMDKFTLTKLTIRFTSDDMGETLSISDDNIELMMAVSYKAVEELVKEARMARKGGN